MRILCGIVFEDNPMALLAGCDSQVVGLVGSYVPSSPFRVNGRSVPRKRTDFSITRNLGCAAARLPWSCGCGFLGRMAAASLVVRKRFSRSYGCGFLGRADSD